MRLTTRRLLAVALVLRLAAPPCPHPRLEVGVRLPLVLQRLPGAAPAAWQGLEVPSLRGGDDRDPGAQAQAPKPGDVSPAPGSKEGA